jgi:hypothetical protein
MPNPRHEGTDAPTPVTSACRAPPDRRLRFERGMETRLPGWGTWIRTEIDGVRVASPGPCRARAPK